MILNAEDHLDSDLAVDGLTLLDAVHGHWRWHYPGTPHMGILPVLASYPQALIWEANPVTLVGGGTVLWMLVVASTFGLAWRAQGPTLAAWAIVPLVFSSVGTIWLSGRITGGHLLALAWHASAFLGFDVAMKRGGWRSAAMLGAWCGLGLYVDAMLLATIAGIAAAAIGRTKGLPTRSELAIVASFLVGVTVGILPREIGRIVDPYDAYPSQFEAKFAAPAIEGHADLLLRECLPRLIAGTGFSTCSTGIGALAMSMILATFAAALVRLAIDAFVADDHARRGVARGPLVSAVIVTSAFVVNRNIYNSDNYRYLVFLMTPWCLGFGLLMGDLCRLGTQGRLSAVLIAATLAAGMTTAAVRWYRDTRHYLDNRGFPVRREVPPWSQLVILPDRAGGPGVEHYTIPADVTHVFGGYWDIYRLSFRSGGRVVGVPYPMYPNRFRGWSDGLGPGRGKIVILRPLEDPASGSRVAAEMPGIRPGRVRSARAIDWRRPLATSWAADGRDPAEIDRLDVVVP